MSEYVIETDAYRRLEMDDLDWTTVEEKAAFYGELKGFAEEKGYKPAFAAVKYRTRFGEYPNDRHVRDAPTIPCGVSTRLWIKASQQDFWKRKHV